MHLLMHVMRIGKGLRAVFSKTSTVISLIIPFSDMVLFQLPLSSPLHCLFWALVMFLTSCP